MAEVTHLDTPGTQDPSSEPLKDKRAVILLSGGMDSTTLFAKHLKEGFTLYPVIFNYGQRHQEAENAAALKVFDYYFTLFGKQLPVKPKFLNLDLRQIGSSALTDDKWEVPTDMAQQARTVVPYRNTQLTTLAAAYGETLGVTSVILGPCKEDYEAYPDCREDFVKSLERTLSLGATKQPTRINLLTPFVNTWKKNIIHWGITNGVPYELTWSCYTGGVLRDGIRVPCCAQLEPDIAELHKNPVGCPADVERVAAFRDNNTKDPLLTSVFRRLAEAQERKQPQTPVKSGEKN
jgi:7-cyano-7-deazaguanine synthase